MDKREQTHRLWFWLFNFFLLNSRHTGYSARCSSSGLNMKVSVFNHYRARPGSYLFSKGLARDTVRNALIARETGVLLSPVFLQFGRLGLDFVVEEGDKFALRIWGWKVDRMISENTEQLVDSETVGIEVRMKVVASGDDLSRRHAARHGVKRAAC
jgi:hypothetical protein